MRRVIFSVTLLLIALLFSASVIASDVDDARYRGTARVTNTGATDESCVSVNLTLPTEDMLESYMDDIYDAAVISATGGDIPFMPSVNSTIPWYIFTENVSAYSSLDYIFYCGNVTGGKIRHFGTLTISDNTSMEISDNGSVVYSGYIDTTKTGTAVWKPNAFSIVYGSGNITTNILNPTGSTSSAYRPDSAGDTTQLTPTAGANYACVSDESDATYVFTWTSYKEDLYNIPDHSTEPGTINYITVSSRLKDAYAGSNTVSWIPTIKIAGVSHNGTGWSGVVNTWGNKSENFATNPATGTAWTWDDIDDLQIGLNIKISAGQVNCSEVWMTVNYESAVLSVTSVEPPGDYIIEATANSTHLLQYVDTILKDSIALSGNTTPDNSSDWVIGGSGAPYIEYFELSIGGVQRCYIPWAFSDTAFPDESGNGNTATPTFPSGCSADNVSASLINFTPINQAKAESSSVSYEGELVTDPPDMPSTFYSESSSPGIFFAPVINTFLDAANVPRSLFWYPFAYIIVIIGGVISYRITQSLFIQALTMGSLILFFSLPGINVYGMWTVLYFGFEAFAVIILSKHYSW